MGSTTTYQRDGAYVTDPVIGTVGGGVRTPGVSFSQNGTTVYEHSGLKNTAAQSTSGTAISATRRYDAFGMVMASTGTFQGPFGYGGGHGYQEDETGLRLLGHRYYDASPGRFLTRDPIKDGRNWFTYCGNDPVNRADATGLEWHDPVSISVDPDFKGKVWIVGEPGPNDTQIFLPVKPGGVSPAGMDVDIVIIQTVDNKGRVSQRRYFLSGANTPQDPRQIGSSYSIDKNGDISRGPDVWNEVAGGYWPGSNRRSSVGFWSPVGLAIEFGVTPWPFPKGGRVPKSLGSATGNLNDDIEKAKRDPRSRIN